MQEVEEVAGARAGEREQSLSIGLGLRAYSFALTAAICSSSKRSWAGFTEDTKLVPANVTAPDTSRNPLKPVGVSPTRTTLHCYEKNSFRLGNLKSFCFALLDMFSRPFLFVFLLSQV